MLRECCAAGSALLVLFAPLRVFAQEVDIAPDSWAPRPREVEPIPEVSVHAKAPPRSASDWEVDHDIVNAAPHDSAADTLDTLPGVFVSDRALLGQAPHLSLRGFEGTSGQDVEMMVGNLPMNQVANIRAPGYADVRLVMPEVIKSLRIASGPYDPRQGDFAVAGSVHMDLGLEEPGFLAKGTLGSFGSRRILLGFAPDDREWRDTFAAFQTSATNGPGTGRGGEQSSFVGQLAFANNGFEFHGVALIGTARYDFPGYAPLSSIALGAYPYTAMSPLGRDRTSQGHLATEFAWKMGGGALTLGVFGSKTTMDLHQDLTGYLLDVLAGAPPMNGDDRDQINDATTIGMNTSYRHGVKLTSKRDMLEVGVFARLDDVDQSDTRLAPDGTKVATLVDRSIAATNIAAYADAALYPWRRFVIRGGLRLDSLSYTVTDHTLDLGLDRTTQGFHLGGKATIDYSAGGGAHVVASYGDGFRSPEARELPEGNTVPIATVHALEAGVRVKRNDVWQASLVGFQSWLSQDRVFDAVALEDVPAPSSSRTGASGAMTVHWGHFATSFSATYARAVFTGSDANFLAGSPVPYAPRFVERSDTVWKQTLGTVGKHALVAKIGCGIEGAAGRPLPDGTDGKNIFYVDALASAAWREFELSVNGMNLLGLRYYDTEYVYASNFQKSTTAPVPSAHVLVAPPTSVFATLTIRVKGLGFPDVPE